MNPYDPPKSSVSSPSFLNAKLHQVTCPHCKHGFEGVAQKTFLGFQSFTCRQCHKVFGYPLFRGYRITYWVLLAVAACFMVNARSFRPNIFFLLMALAIVVDIHRLWKRRA